jgi:hypothetical protein
LDEGSAYRRDFYITQHNTRDRHPRLRQNANPQFSGQPQSLALHRSATGSGQVALRLGFHQQTNEVGPLFLVTKDCRQLLSRLAE